MNVASSESGMATAMAKVGRPLRRKRNMNRTAKRPPISPDLETFEAMFSIWAPVSMIRRLELVPELGLDVVDLALMRWATWAGSPRSAC